MTRLRRPRPVPPQRRADRIVAGIAAVLLVAAAGSGFAVRLLPAPPSAVRLAWWLILAGFAVAQSVSVDIQVKRQARSVSLTEVPFVIGLFGCAAPWFVVARVGGGLVSQLLVRRQWRQPKKLGFNLVLSLAEAALALAVFRALAGGAATGWRDMAAALAATAAANAVGGVAVGTIVARMDGLSLGTTLRGAVADLPQGAGVSCAGLVAVLALAHSPYAAVPILLLAGVAVIGYRSYSRLANRHHDVERLYDFTRRISGHDTIERLVDEVLRGTTEMMQAESAALLTFSRDNDDQPTSTWVTGARREALAAALAGTDPWPFHEVIRRQAVRLLPRESREPVKAGWLRGIGCREALIAPLPLSSPEAGPAVLVVVDRLGESRGFDSSDVQLLDTAARQIAVALDNGRLLEQLRLDSMYDALTGLPNRSEVHRHVEGLLEVGGQFVMAVIRVTAYDDVTEAFGHEQADLLIREVAARLSSRVREPAMIGRTADDRFTVVLPGLSGSADVVTRRCTDLLQPLRSPIVIEGIPIDSAIAIGVVDAAEYRLPVTELQQLAEAALQAGQDRDDAVCAYDASMSRKSPDQLAMLVALREAIDARRLDVAYQPQVSCASGRPAGVEALARWTDDRFGFVSPAVFIPLAERSGLIRPLTDLMLEQALSACRQWQLTAPGVGISVNLSPRSLRDPDLVDRIAGMLQRNDLPPHLLTLEVTESTVMTDPIVAIDIMRRLRALGLHLSIDDFGSGYSSLSMLRQMPVQELKIDRSFVQAMDRSGEDDAIVRTILQLAATLELTVVAEGVETAEALAALTAMGCGTVQGYYTARPMPFRAVLAWLREAPVSLPLSSPLPSP